MVCLLPAQQTDHVCERGRLRAAPVAAGALEAPRQAREREGYGPTKLAEPLVCGSRVADFGSCPCVYGDNLTTKHPLTGEPDAGDPPVRFGGRGSANTLSLPLSIPLNTYRGIAPSFRCRYGTVCREWPNRVVEPEGVIKLLTVRF